jgi:predicted acetyltransferase
MEWPDGFQGDNKLRNWAHNPKNNPVCFVLVERDILISHVAVVWKYITHKNVRYKMYALSGMLTYPQFRKQGYGLKILKKATEYMLKQDGDFIMIHSKLKDFYEKAGFEPLPKVVTLVGNPHKPKNSGEKAFAIFITGKGKQGRKDFESEPFYFGESLW